MKHHLYAPLASLVVLGGSVLLFRWILQFDWLQTGSCIAPLATALIGMFIENWKRSGSSTTPAASDARHTASVLVLVSILGLVGMWAPYAQVRSEAARSNEAKQCIREQKRAEDARQEFLRLEGASKTLIGFNDAGQSCVCRLSQHIPQFFDAVAVVRNAYVRLQSLQANLTDAERQNLVTCRAVGSHALRFCANEWILGHTNMREECTNFETPQSVSILKKYKADTDPLVP